MPLYSRKMYRRTLPAFSSTFGSCDMIFMYEATDPYALYLFLRRRGLHGGRVTQLFLTDREQFAEVMMHDGAISDHHGKVIVSNMHPVGLVCIELCRGGTSYIYTLSYDDVWRTLLDTWALVPEGDEHDVMSDTWDKALTRLLQEK